jgi:hypothetical protein
MLRNYDGSKPSDVRQFVQEVARITATGPIGAAQVERHIQELAKSPEGKLLLKNARLSAKVDAEAFGVSFTDIKVHTDANADNFRKSMPAQAFVTGSEIFFAEGQTGAKSSGAAEVLAHELTHVVQQSAKAGKR